MSQIKAIQAIKDNFSSIFETILNFTEDPKKVKSFCGRIASSVLTKKDDFCERMKTATLQIFGEGDLANTIEEQYAPLIYSALLCIHKDDVIKKIESAFNQLSEPDLIIEEDIRSQVEYFIDGNLFQEETSYNDNCITEILDAQIVTMGDENDNKTPPWEDEYHAALLLSQNMINQAACLFDKLNGIESEDLLTNANQSGYRNQRTEPSTRFYISKSDNPDHPINKNKQKWEDDNPTPTYNSDDDEEPLIITKKHKTV